MMELLVDDNPLTEAEMHIAKLVYVGLTNKQIADARCVTVGTVSNMLYHIYDKLNLSKKFNCRVMLAVWYCHHHVQHT